MSSPILQVQGVSKSFGNINAVNNVSFTVNKGEVYGFLGQNGAGKSTMIRMLLTLVKPDSGSIKIFGLELMQHRNEILRQVGAIIEKPDLYKYLSALENLRLFARISGRTIRDNRIWEFLELTGLADRANDKVKTFSQGMKQRLGIAVALVHDPQFVILDEPTNGLDPQGIADIRNLILHLSRHSGKTLLVSSHLLSEMELIADRMLILDRGKVAKEGSIAELFQQTEVSLSVKLINREATMQHVISSEWQPYFRGHETDTLQFQIDKALIPGLIQFLVSRNAEILSVQHRHSLEEYFLSLTTANQHVDTFED